MSKTIPRWDLVPIYAGLDSDDYKADKVALDDTCTTLLELLDRAERKETDPQAWLPRALDSMGKILDLMENLESYVYALWSTDTADESYQKELNDFEKRGLAAKNAATRLRGLLPGLAADWEHLLRRDDLAPHRFWLDEQRFFASKQLTVELEALAADLQRSGGDAWGRLQEQVSSSLSRPWEGGQKTVVELRSLAFHRDREIRRRAWDEELKAWESMEIPLAAALNGVKGVSITLNLKRGWGSSLERSLVQNRLSRTALDAMLGVMNESLPQFRRYFNAKARMLGLERLSWYDLFAPVGEAAGGWTWEKTRTFIPEKLSSFERDMGDFASQAFEKNWIDAEARSGKVGGAYCTSFPLAAQSRILCNFDGSFDSVSTVAHELGHAWHSHVLQDLPPLSKEYPMILAETASLFFETLVFHAAFEESSEEDEPVLLDTSLMGASQVIVDILSRFYFENALMRRRRDGELSPRELKELMLDAQERCYGDALHAEERHPWMWAVKGHYYGTDLAFYNFPYAFGQLFALGLYALYREEGPAFAGKYKDLLRMTGRENALAVGRAADFNIEDPDFWRRGIGTLTESINQFTALVEH